MTIDQEIKDVADQLVAYHKATNDDPGSDLPMLTEDLQSSLRMLAQEAVYVLHATDKWHDENPSHVHDTLVGLIPYEDVPKDSPVDRLISELGRILDKQAADKMPAPVGPLS